MKRGFTLIELLVVIAIIAILAAILFPVFARAREKARQTSCLSNVKQIVLGILQYCQDYDERFPGSTIPPANWYGAITPYIKNAQIFICPSRPDWDNAYGGYGYNDYGSDSTNGLGWRTNYSSQLAPTMAKIEQPANMFLVGESQAENMYFRGYLSTSNQPSDRHNGGSNVGHVDGHAKWYAAQKIRATQLAGWKDPTDPVWAYWVRKPSSASGR